jgi:hypothetical protein
MNYSINRLSTIADCDAVLALAQKDKADLEFKNLSLQRNYQSYQSRSVQLTADIQVTQAEINALTTVIAGLPDGDTKDDNIAKQKRLEYRLFTLQEQSENYGVIALLEKELEINFVEKQLAETLTFIQLVETKKTSI